jgi:CheY-like chemotaxis protein
MDGIETTKKIRGTNYIGPIVALTANAIAGQADVFFKNGFDDFVSKPIDIWRLDDILNKYVPVIETEVQKEISPEQAEELLDTITKLKNIDGVNAASALEAMSNMEELYIDTAKLTLRLLPERIEKMDRLLKTDMPLFTVEVHGLKSVLNNIGAMALGNGASQLERAAIDNNKTFCSRFYPTFRKGLVILEERLRDALTENDAEKEEADKYSIKSVIADAKKAAESFDMNGALGIISNCAMFKYDDETDKILQEIVFALEAFNCKDAVIKINKLEEILNG